MFRKSFLCSLACAVAISGAGANNSVSAGGTVSKVVCCTVGVVSLADGVINTLQHFGVGVDKVPHDGNGILGEKGAIGGFTQVAKKRGEDGAWKGLTVSIVKDVAGLAEIIFPFLPI